MKMIIGEEAPKKGELHLFGTPLADKTVSDFREEMNYCPQKDALFPRIAVQKQLEFFARLRGLSRNDTKNLLESAFEVLKIEKYANRLFRDFFW